MSSNSYIIEIGTGRTTQPYDGRYVTTIGDPTPPDIGTGHYQPPPIPQGWQCPLCRTVYAPSVTMCKCDVPKLTIGGIDPSRGGVMPAHGEAAE